MDPTNQSHPIGKALWRKNDSSRFLRPLGELNSEVRISLQRSTLSGAIFDWWICRMYPKKKVWNGIFRLPKNENSCVYSLKFHFICRILQRIVPLYTSSNFILFDDSRKSHFMCTLPKVSIHLRTPWNIILFVDSLKCHVVCGLPEMWFYL